MYRVYELSFVWSYSANLLVVRFSIADQRVADLASNGLQDNPQHVRIAEQRYIQL